MSVSSRMGLGFGATSGIITTLGLITGLTLGTGSKVAVISGIITIAVADALSDAFGMHVSQESANKYSDKAVWKATVTTFVSKFLFAMSFLLPELLFDLKKAMYVGYVWGLSLIAVFAYVIAKRQNKNPWTSALEHSVTAILVTGASYITGIIIRSIL